MLDLFRGKKSAVIRYGIQMKQKRLHPKLEDQRRCIASVGQLEDMLVHRDYAHAVTEHEGKKLSTCKPSASPSSWDLGLFKFRSL